MPRRPAQDDPPVWPDPARAPAPPAVLERLVERALDGRRAAPAEARAAYDAILAGRSPLLGHADRDGRRYLFASPPAPGPAPRPLPPTVRAAVALAVRGASGKQIAFALGVDRSRVSRLLRAATDRLGLAHPVDLPRLLGGGPADGAAPAPEVRTLPAGPAAPPVVALVEPLRPGDGRLTTAEREVAGLLAAGLAYAHIAARRGVSPRTVGNQASAIYRKLGLRGREEIAWLVGRTEGGATTL